MRALVIGVVCLAVSCGSAVGLAAMLRVGARRDRLRYQGPAVPCYRRGRLP